MGIAELMKDILPEPGRSSITTDAIAAPVEAFQKSFAPSQELIARPWTRAQKRKRAIEDEHSQKRLREDPPSVSLSAVATQDLIGISQARGRKPPHGSKNKRSRERRQRLVQGPKLPLNKENLRKLQSLTESDVLNKMSSTGTNSDRTRKRAPSQRTSASEINQDSASLRSQKSAISNTNYRYEILGRARIYIHPIPPPKNIQSKMNTIFKREILKERKDEIVDIAKTTSRNFADVLLGANREDDLLEPFHDALRSMDRDGVFNFPRKAGGEPPFHLATVVS